MEDEIRWCAFCDPAALVPLDAAPITLRRKDTGEERTGPVCARCLVLMVEGRFQHGTKIVEREGERMKQTILIRPCLLGFAVEEVIERDSPAPSTIRDYGIFNTFHDLLWALLNTPGEFTIRLF